MGRARAQSAASRGGIAPRVKVVKHAEVKTLEDLGCGELGSVSKV